MTDEKKQTASLNEGNDPDPAHHQRAKNLRAEGQTDEPEGEQLQDKEPGEQVEGKSKATKPRGGEGELDPKLVQPSAPPGEQQPGKSASSDTTNKTTNPESDPTRLGKEDPPARNTHDDTASTPSLGYGGELFNVTNDKRESYDQAVKDFLKKAGENPMDSTVTVNGDWTNGNGKDALKNLINSGAKVIEGESCKFDKETQERLDIADEIRNRMKKNNVKIPANFFEELVEDELRDKKQSAADNADTTDSMKKSTTDSNPKTDNTVTTNPVQQKPANSDSLGIQAKDPQSKKQFKSETFFVGNHTEGPLKGEPDYDTTVSDCLKHAAKSGTPPTELTATINGSWKGEGAEPAIKKLIESGVKVDFGKDFKPSDKLQKLNDAAQDVRELRETMEKSGQKPTETFEKMLDDRMKAPDNPPEEKKSASASSAPTSTAPISRLPFKVPETAPKVVKTVSPL